MNPRGHQLWAGTVVETGGWILVCRACGHYAEKAPQKLAEQCTGFAMTKWPRAVRSRVFEQGVHPQGKHRVSGVTPWTPSADECSAAQLSAKERQPRWSKRGTRAALPAPERRPFKGWAPLVLPNLRAVGLQIDGGELDAVDEAAEDDAPWGRLDGVPIAGPANEELGARRRARARLVVAGLLGEATLASEVEELVRRVLSGWDPIGGLEEDDGGAGGGCEGSGGEGGAP